MKNLFAELKTSIVATVTLAVILCGLYPLIVWALAQGFYPARANGSLVRQGPTVIGSSLIGQTFFGPRYFHPRPSAAGAGYDPLHSGGTNLGPLSRKLANDMRQRIEAYRAENGLPSGAEVPADAVTSSGSGLDPDISLENARIQAPRVAGARGLETETVLRQVEACRQGRTFGLLGEPRVNVLLLNLTLDALPEAQSAVCGPTSGAVASGARE
jgi:K+-transporting ATPase ATPase C chain